MNVSAFISRWRQSAASERSNKDSFLRDLCDVLGVPHPDPATGDPDRDRYTFERDAVLVHGGEKRSIGKIDLYKHGCFVLEAKQGSDEDSRKVGSARRGTPGWNVAMQDAFGQAHGYTTTLEQPPPFLIVTDIGYCFDLYASFDGTRNYRKFPDALSSRISIESLEREPAHLETLRAIFTDPHSLDPSKRSVKVTRDVAGYLANVARSLGDEGHDPEKVAKFLMRCLFTMFAEDVELLPRGIFVEALNRWTEQPETFPGEVEELWRKMNEGGTLWGGGRVWKFNGGLFAEPEALPLKRHQLAVLRLAAASNWSDVEPAIFGTLLERALDPKERHRLGAHYTPRAYVERLVRPTIEEPLREEWDNVRAQVQKMVGEAGPDPDRKTLAEARKIVAAFHHRLTTLRVLDPACGSGNFLYVALDLFKRIENEVFELLDILGNDRSILTIGGMVTPQQFLGIEIKPWAKEISELVLWIGWLQWQIRTRGWKSDPPEPILRDYHNIECRDAVLAYDAKEPLLDDEGNPVTRWDGETMKLHPVTGEEVPDETARVPVWRYVNPRKAEWPEAEFIVGNPPFIGDKKMRLSLGGGYVEALRESHRDVPETADFVMYWWNQAARLLSASRIARFGLITTNSITQAFNRQILAKHLEHISIRFAIPDHPWVDTESGAAVRIAMTVASYGKSDGTLNIVTSEIVGDSDEIGVVLSPRSGRIGMSLRFGTTASDALRLKSNQGLSFMGISLIGQGFVVTVDDTLHRSGSPRLRPFLIGRDLTQRPTQKAVIDFNGLTEQDARLADPQLMQRVIERVQPERMQNNREGYRKKWWLFGEQRSGYRAAIANLGRYVATCRTAVHRTFCFVPRETLVESTVIAIALDDSFHLGVLSSRPHLSWTLSSGGTLEDRPRYNNSLCFDPFPFPDPDEFTKQRIRNLGEQLDAHRKRQQELHPELTITGMYNVLEKLRAGEALTAKERGIHEQGLVSVLKQIHDDLDAAVFDAYGWPHDLPDEAILERLVALNAERAEEERRGIVRWLRPEFQNPSGATAPSQTTMAVESAAAEVKPAKASERPSWPKELSAQIPLVRDVVAAHGSKQKSWSADEVAKWFKAARRADVASVLAALSSLGLLVTFETPEGPRWSAP